MRGLCCCPGPTSTACGLISTREARCSSADRDWARWKASSSKGTLASYQLPTGSGARETFLYLGVKGAGPGKTGVCGGKLTPVLGLGVSALVPLTEDSYWDPGSGWCCSQIWRSRGFGCIDRAVPSLLGVRERGQAKRYRCSCPLASSTRGGRGCPGPAGGWPPEPRLRGCPGALRPGLRGGREGAR